jgi:predicted enzyme related to lactoylglutathione lyase
MIKRLKFTTVFVKDQDRALAFYTKTLGLEIFTDQPMGKSRWIELQVPGGETMVVLFHKPDHRPDEVPALVFVVDSVEGTYRELAKKGVEFVQPPKKAQWGESAILRDPEGNLVLLGT